MRALLYSVVVAVLWYVGGMTGSRAFLTAAVALAVLGVSLWCLGRWSRRHLNVRLAAPAADVPRGRQAPFALSVENRSRIPVGVVQVQLVCRYRDHRCAPLKLTVQATCHSRSAMGAWVRVDAPHCGVLEVRACELVAWDPLGLWRSRKQLDSGASASVVPQGDHPATLALPLLSRFRSAAPRDAATRPGSVPPDVHDLRAYRPGDSLRAVHWKLSARSESLITRIHRDDDPADAVLLVDAGDQVLAADEVDALLEAAANVADGLVRAGATFTVAWPEREGVQTQVMRSPADAASLRHGLAEACFGGGAAPLLDMPPLCTLRPGPALYMGETLVARFGSDGVLASAENGGRL